MMFLGNPISALNVARTFSPIASETNGLNGLLYDVYDCGELDRTNSLSFDFTQDIVILAGRASTAVFLAELNQSHNLDETDSLVNAMGYGHLMLTDLSDHLGYNRWNLDKSGFRS